MPFCPRNFKTDKTVSIFVIQKRRKPKMRHQSRQKKLIPMKKFYFRKTKTALATLMLLPFFSFAQITLLQTTNNAITTATLSCGPGNNITSQNDFARLYNLTALGYSKFQVTKVSFAVHGFQQGTASNFPVSVKVYASTGGTSDANLTLKVEASINITAAMVGTVVEVPLTTPAEVTSPEMLIVVSAPDGLSTSTGLYLGGNSNGQTAPGYIKAASCGATNFTSYNDVGAANQHLILFPTGNATTLGVENLDSANKTISIYPNPVKSVLNFSEEVSNITITDLTGRTLKQIPTSAKSVNVATLEKGNYIITGTTKSGNAITKKLIKE